MIAMEWSPFAWADREAIFDYIERDNVANAVLVDERLEQQIEMLMEFPEMGRPGRVAGTRELVVQGTPYIVAYRLQDTTVRVLRILHGAMMWPEELSRR